MRIIVDVMGGDKAPEATVIGALMAANEFHATCILVGDQDRIIRIAADNGLDIRRTDIIDTKEYITMEDDPLTVVRGKTNSSMTIGLKMLSQGEGDAFVSAGNTGALFTGATLIVRKVKGVLRAGIATVIPLQNPVLLLDCGANVVVTPENLEQFGMLGSAYMNKMFGIKKPRVGLLNNGSESCKGTELQKTAFTLLSDNPDINFVGNVEANVLPFDICDVIVADGFTGNIYLKSVEGLGKLLFGKLKEVFYSNTVTKVAAMTLKKPLYEMKKEFDPSEHGGSPIIGIAKPVIKAHGSSDAKAFKNAIRQAIEYADSGAIYEIAKATDLFALHKKEAKTSENTDCRTEE